MASLSDSPSERRYRDVLGGVHTGLLLDSLQVVLKQEPSGLKAYVCAIKEVNRYGYPEDIAVYIPIDFPLYDNLHQMVSAVSEGFDALMKVPEYGRRFY